MKQVLFQNEKDGNVFRRWLKDNLGLRTEMYHVQDEEEEETTHQENCECGKCTGEDRALKMMEEGIIKAETSYTE